jgi:hypothetical protein
MQAQLSLPVKVTDLNSPSQGNSATSSFSPRLFKVSSVSVKRPELPWTPPISSSVGTVTSPRLRLYKAQQALRCLGRQVCSLPLVDLQLSAAASSLHRHLHLFIHTLPFLLSSDSGNLWRLLPQLCEHQPTSVPPSLEFHSWALVELN